MTDKKLIPTQETQIDNLVSQFYTNAAIRTREAEEKAIGQTWDDVNRAAVLNYYALQETVTTASSIVLAQVHIVKEISRGKLWSACMVGDFGDLGEMLDGAGIPSYRKTRLMGMAKVMNFCDGLGIEIDAQINDWWKFRGLLPLMKRAVEEMDAGKVKELLDVVDTAASEGAIAEYNRQENGKLPTAGWGTFKNLEGGRLVMVMIVENDSDRARISKRLGDLAKWGLPVENIDESEALISVNILRDLEGLQ